MYHFPKTRQWRYTPASGMLMTGPQGVDLSRQIGHKLLSLLHTETSTQMLAFGPLGHLLVVQVVHLLPPQVVMLGSLKRWTQQAKRGSTGCKRITWFTTTARTQSDFLKAFLQNALPQTRPKYNTASRYFLLFSQIFASEIWSKQLFH